MRAYTVIVGQEISVELNPQAFPFHIRLGSGHREALWPSKYKEDGELKARARFKIPNLPKGQYPLIVEDSHGQSKVGIVKIV